MFKNYLTYQFAEGFDRDCAALEGLEAPTRNELLRCSHAVVVFLGRAIRARDPSEKAKALFTALAYSQDCRELLARAGVSEAPVNGRLKILEARLEQLFAETSQEESGQLRMLS